MVELPELAAAVATVGLAGVVVLAVPVQLATANGKTKCVAGYYRHLFELDRKGTGRPALPVPGAGALCRQASAPGGRGCCSCRAPIGAAEAGFRCSSPAKHRYCRGCMSKYIVAASALQEDGLSVLQGVNGGSASADFGFAVGRMHKEQRHWLGNVSKVGKIPCPLFPFHCNCQEIPRKVLVELASQSDATTSAYMLARSRVATANQQREDRAALGAQLARLEREFGNKEGARAVILRLRARLDPHAAPAPGPTSGPGSAATRWGALRQAVAMGAASPSGAPRSSHVPSAALRQSALMRSTSSHSTVPPRPTAPLAPGKLKRSATKV